MFNAKAYSTASATSPLVPTTIQRRDPGERDVQLEILFCGICHSDLHQVFGFAIVGGQRGSDVHFDNLTAALR